MVFGIRADSFPLIGTGHVNRCLILAEILKKKKIKSYFICKDIDKENLNKIKKKKISLLRLKKSNKTNIKLDSDLTIKFIKSKRISHLIIDNYNLDLNWKKKVSNFCKLIVIDDFIFKRTYCDYYVNYHDINKKVLNKKKFFQKKCIKLLGPDFSIIKPFKYRKSKKDIIFVFMGGTDKNNFTLKTMKILNNSNFIKYKIIVMVGKYNNKKKQLINFAKKFKNFLIVKDNYKDLYNFFARSKLVISGGGVTMYENLSYGSNSLFIPQSEIQKKIIYNYINHNLLNFVSRPKFLNVKKISRILDYDNQRNIFKRKKIFNKNGAIKIIKNIIN